MYATNIDWDTGHDMEIFKQLPAAVKLPDSLRGDVDSIADFLSDEYGFCVFSFNVET